MKAMPSKANLGHVSPYVSVFFVTNNLHQAQSFSQLQAEAGVMANDLYIGKRLSYDDAACTVRYIGEVADTEGDWIGVEWDTSSRGRNSGDAKGVKYFECMLSRMVRILNNSSIGRSKEAKPASFIRPGRASDVPRTFLEALKYKYASAEVVEDSNSNLAYEVGKNPIRISGKQVEEVGFDKINKQLAALDELKIVILDGLRISQPITRDVEEEKSNELEVQSVIKETCPKITQLDLGKNLFEELREIGLICDTLQYLTELKLEYDCELFMKQADSYSGNRFRCLWQTQEQLEQLRKAFSKVYQLGLCYSLLTWDEVRLSFWRHCKG
jgi:tubulin-specific chaperone E